MNAAKSPIPIKNLFYMLCYAWNVLAIKDQITVSLDDYDDAYNLLGRVFSYGISKLIRVGFHRSYVTKEEELTTLRGKVNLQSSIKNLSFQHKKLICNYDEYSSDDMFNQILHYTIDSLLKNSIVDKEIKKELKKQESFFIGIDKKPPTKDNRRSLLFNKNSILYKLLICISTMIYNNTSLNEEEGKEIFEDFFREKQMQDVYQKFLLNFYAIHLDKAIYRVYAPKFNWLKSDEEDLWEDLDDADAYMPELRTDIVIENKQSNVQFIIDAKYYKEALVTSHHSTAKKFRRDHISQVFTYMANSPYVSTKRGALLYPTVTNVPDGKQSTIQGYVFFKSINLNDDWKNIEKSLLDFAYKATK